MSFTLLNPLVFTVMMISFPFVLVSIFIIIDEILYQLAAVFIRLIISGCRKVRVQLDSLYENGHIEKEEYIPKSRDIERRIRKAKSFLREHK